MCCEHHTHSDKPVTMYYLLISDVSRLASLYPVVEWLAGWPVNDDLQ